MTTLSSPRPKNYDAEHVGCFEENKRDRHFKLSPGNYDPKSLTPEKCSSVCGAYAAPYAGMTDGRFCFCGSAKPETPYKAADDDCSSTCSGDDKTKCGSPDHISVYHTFQPIKNVEMNVTGKSIPTTGEPVTFSVSTEAGYNIFYHMDYGDGTQSMGRNTTGMFTKEYHIPGQHIAEVTASDDSGSVKKTSVAAVNVQAPVKNVSVVCPYFSSYEEKACTVTITHGTNLRLHDKVNSKDRTIKIADPVIGVAGCCVPYTAKAEPETLSGDDDVIFIMPAAEFRFHGVVTHWELWADKEGKITVMVLKPDCDDYCYETNTCGGSCKGTTCSSGKTFCHQSGTCSKECKETQRYPSDTPLVDYIERQSTELTVSKGHQVVECPYMNVSPGDIIAYKKSSDSATITVSKKETTGDRKYGGATKQFSKNSGTPVPKTRHHLRAVYSSQTKVSLTYKFIVAKKYTLSVNVSNVDIEGSETATTVIDVREGINATILVGPKYLPVNTEGIFTILPHTGSSVKRDWDFGDKSVFNATDTDQYKHTYTSKGIYNISVRCWNSEDTKENVSMVTVEEAIVDMSVKYSPCITLSNCSFEVTVTGGSNFEITWDFGDLTSNVTTEADYLESHIVKHVYTTGGNLTVSANCSNHISSKPFTFFLSVQEVCSGLSLIRTGAEKNVPFRIEWTLAHGSNCKFELKFRGQVIAIEKANTTTRRWESAMQNGLPANIYPLVLKVSNAIGHDEKHVNFTVETAMKGMKSNCSTSLISTGEEASCSVTIAEGSNVQCVWDFDDGTVERFSQGPQDWALRASTPEIRKHIFTKSKNYNVSITCSNNDRSEPKYHSVVVMQGVNEVELKHDNAVPFNRPGIGIFSFEAPNADPENAQVQFSFGDNQFDSKELKLNFNYTHRYRDAGCYMLYVRIWNTVGQKIFNNTQICVVEKIQGLKIITEPVDAIINQPIAAKVIMHLGPAGSLTNISCDYGDGGGKKTFLRRGKQIDGEDVRSITYKKLGQTTITCDVVTPLETLTTSKKVKVDQEVSSDNCHITTNYPVEHGKKIVYSVVCDKDPMPTNAHITIDHGDGTSEKVLFTGKAGVPQTISYSPPKDGHFIAKISLGNGGSSVNVSLPAGSYKRLVGNPEFKCQYKKTIPVNSGYKDGIEGMNQNFPTSSPLTCRSGHYTATLKVGNPLGSVSADPKDLQMKEPVHGIHIVDLTPKAKVEEEKTFRISFDSMGDEVCMNIDFGDDEGETFNYGTEEWCEKESSFDDGEFTDEMKNPMEVTRTYYENQNYELKATAVNLFSDARVTFSFSISEYDCDKPEVSIEDAVTVFTNPMTFEKSKGIVLRGKANITCAASLQNTKSWKIEVIDPDWGSVKKTLDLKSDKAEFVVKAKSLPYGLYKATYSIQMDLPDDTNFVESAFSYFKVTKSEIVVVMDSGGISEIDRGENRMVTLSPEKYSYDPDVDRSADQEFDSYTWKCKLMKKVSSTSACEYLSKMTTGSITFNSSIFQTGEQVQLTCNVTKDSRSSVGTILINFVEGNPPNLYIEPVGSSRTVQLAESKMVSSEERLALKVRCKDCEKAKLSCMKTDTIAILPSLYKLHPDVKKYRFSCKCRQGDGDNGKASLNIDLNPPPQPGNCELSPRNGTIGLDNNSPFNVKCSGWTDETEIVEYKFFCTHKNSKLHHQITTFEEAQDVTIEPPLGADDDEYREHVYVSVKDSMEAAYVYDLGIIQVFPNTANMGEWSAKQKTNALNEIEKVTASGDQKSVTEKLTKLASLLNADKAHNKPGAPDLALTEFQPAGHEGMDFTGISAPNMGLANFQPNGGAAPGMANFGVGGGTAPGMGNFGAGVATAPGMGNFETGGGKAPGMGNFGIGGAGAPGMGNFKIGGGGAPSLPGFKMADGVPGLSGLPGFPAGGAPGLPGLPGMGQFDAGGSGAPGMGKFGTGDSGAPGMGKFETGGAGVPGMGTFETGGAGAPGMGKFETGGAGAPGMGKFETGGAGAPGMGKFETGGAGAPGMGNFGAGGAEAPGMGNFKIGGGGAPSLPGFKMADGVPGLSGLPGFPAGGAPGLPGLPGMGQFDAGGSGAPGMGQFGTGGSGAPGMGQFGTGGAGAPGMGSFKLGGGGAPGLPGFKMAGGVPGLSGMPDMSGFDGGADGGSSLGSGMSLNSFKIAGGVGGLDSVGTPAEQKALIQKAEKERDNKAKLRDTIAGACANMTTPDSTAMEQVLTCLHTNAKESAECTKLCQKATMLKTLEISKELSHLNTSSENTKALGTALLNVAQEAAAAAVVNIQWPVLSDKLTAMDTSEFEDYDTDIESNQSGKNEWMKGGGMEEIKPVFDSTHIMAIQRFVWEVRF
ncbi:uncharacterized protein [Haliotis asinina]|uniref:uncharacterized protein n=1 Tax=Haliotis asinina TaxID=109174 RepID=UPI003531B510